MILVPVALDRERIGSPYTLRWTGEDVITNYSLQTKLLEQDILFPGFEMPDRAEGIEDYFSEVTQAVHGKVGWGIDPTVHLGFFSFTKFLMYRDLDPASWPEGTSPTDHPLLKSLLAPRKRKPIDRGFREADVDKKLDPRRIFHVLNADSSQIAVIEDVKAGRNLVVEGPPGTGKSQTITNVIAELLASGRTVLFVSEKMAALEVVKERLDNVGLGEFCLELHSQKTNRATVLNELERTLTTPLPKQISLEYEFMRLRKLIEELNSYPSVLHDSHGKLGFSPYQLFSLYEDAAQHFRITSRTVPPIPLDSILQCSPNEWTKTIETLHSFSEILRLVHPVNLHPWFGCSLSGVTPSEEREISELITTCHGSFTSMRKEISSLVRLTGIRSPPSLSDITSAQASARIIADAATLDMTLLMSQNWETDLAIAEKLIALLEEERSLKQSISTLFTSSTISPSLIADLKTFRSLPKGFFSSLRKEHREFRRMIDTLYHSGPPKDPKVIDRHITMVSRYLKVGKEVARSESTGRELFGQTWGDSDEAIEKMRHITGWVRLFRDQSESGRMRERSMDIIMKGPKKERINAIVSEVSRLKNEFIRNLDRLLTRLSTDPDTLFGTDRDSVRLSKFGSKFQLWSDHVTPDLHHWGQYIPLRDSVRSTITAPVITALEAGILEPDDMAPCFIGNSADILIRQVFRERPILASFISELHERKINEFKHLDQDLLLLNRQRLVHRLYLRKPMLVDPTGVLQSAGHSRKKIRGNKVGTFSDNTGTKGSLGGKSQTYLDPADPGLVFLKSEFNRKKGHRPIRSLLLHSGDLVQRIKPCFMMGPLSIAQFLDPRAIQFDTVIFDEASQVRPEDALGALLRGKQVIVMGDTRQLPPTTFFDHVVDDDEMLLDEVSDDQDLSLQAPLSDIESLIHLCKRSFPTKYLKWHYRSKHESLITVSNSEFYDNRMLVFPSPHRRSDRYGLQFAHLKNTIYDRGGGSVNKKEARAVAQAAIHHFRDHPDRTLGIATFSIKQKNVILEEIDRQLHHHPELEEHFKRERYEYFFVKHLETIQGDERDVILISMGYGYDASGKLTMNFGPLNHEGGERRLNVLITRAREKCVVFSNFRGDDIRVSKETPFGVKALRSFLTFAETGALPSRSPSAHPAVIPHHWSPNPVSDQIPLHGVPTGPFTPSEASSISSSNSNSLRAGNVIGPLQQSVAENLATQGFHVTGGIGSGSINVDLAIHDPKDPDRFLMGILTDGPGYHRSRVARDRDCLMETVLEGLGWQFVRIWSPDWFRDPDHTMARLLQQVNSTITSTGYGNIEHSGGRVQGSGRSHVSGQASGKGSRRSARGQEPPAGSEHQPDDVFHTVQRVRKGAIDDRSVVSGIHVPVYEPTTYLGIPVVGDLSDLSPGDLAPAVHHIVSVEGPIHVDEVVRRIRILWGLSRTGPKLRSHLLHTIDKAEHLRFVFRKGDFLFSTDYYSDEWHVPVRSRGRDVRANVDLICDDEIAESMKLILRSRGTVPLKTLIREGTRLLGFTSPGPKVRSRFKQVLDHLAILEEVSGIEEGVVSLETPAE